MSLDLDHGHAPVLTLELMGVSVSVQFDRYDLDRSRYNYRVTCQNVTDQGDDLAHAGEPNLSRALGDLFGFMSDPSLFPNLSRAGLDLEELSGMGTMELEPVDA